MSVPPPPSPGKSKPTRPSAPSDASTSGSTSSPAPARPDVGSSDPKAPKGKSAKELKKEKRAAAVASRPQGDAPSDPRAGPTDSAGGQNQRARPTGPPASGPGGGASDPRARRPDGVTPSTNSGPPAQSSTANQIPSSAFSTSTFFSHLPYHRAPSSTAALNTARIHPVVIRLGLLMTSGALRGANARTIGMMEAFREVIRDYECPETTVLWKDLPVHLSPMIAWLENCRPKGVGGGNAIRWLKSEINRLGEQGDRTEAEQKAILIEEIGIYLRDRIEFAGQVIASSAKEKIRAGDTVVVYARSSLVERVILEAWRDLRSQDASNTFNVIVVDSRPLHEGRALLESLSAAGLPCTYVLLPQLSSLLSRASLVLLGGSALHSDGALFSRAGTAIVAMLAKEHRVPVVACVETYKFGERVVLDAVASNELGEVAGLIDVPIKSIKSATAEVEGSVGAANLTPLALVYDLTPPSLITAVCTEIGFIPPSSVPTVLGKTSMAA